MTPCRPTGGNNISKKTDCLYSRDKITVVMLSATFELKQISVGRLKLRRQ
jgi:hypothetical protein